jgi:hypothetical protein
MVTKDGRFIAVTFRPGASSGSVNFGWYRKLEPEETV